MNESARAVRARFGWRAVEDLFALDQQVLEAGGRQRPAKEVALQFLAALRAQEIEVFLDLHALGDHRAVQAVRHADGGADDGFVVRIDADIAHEGLVDLDAVGRESA